MNMRLMIGVSIVALAVCAAPAGATLLAYEGFDYDFNDLETLNGGTGWATAWNSASGLSNDDTSLNYVGNPNPVVGDRVSVADSNGSARTMSTTLTYEAGNVYYISVLLKRADNGNWFGMKLTNGLQDPTSFQYQGWCTGIGSDTTYGHGGQTWYSNDYGYTDGDTVMVDKGDLMNFSCCDCGLVHWIVLLNQQKTISATFFRDARRTGQRRRRLREKEQKQMKRQKIRLGGKVCRERKE